jgi:GAF domain-containing protein
VARPAGQRSAGAGFSAPEGEDALRLQQLARVTSELGAAETMADVVDAAVNHITGAIGAAVSTLMLREADELHLLAGAGLRPGVLGAWRRFPLEDANPASEAARTGRPVLFRSDEADWEQRFGSLHDQVPAGRSVVCLPMSAGGSAGTAVGVLGLTFEQNWLPGPRELDFLTTFAEACGQAVRRLRTATLAAEQARRLTFLAEASAELSRSLDYRSTLTNVAHLLVPDLADWSAVSVLEDGQLKTLAVAHADPAKVEEAWELERRYPPDPDAATGAAAVARTGRSQLLEQIPDELLVAAARDAEHLRLARDLQLRSAVVVPLAGHGRTLGAITLVRSENERPYGPDDLAVAEELGRRAGIALENALLHGQVRDTAVQLQRAVLPEQLGELPGWRLAAHYEPGDAAQVGGDFYDAVGLPDGRLVVCIGDVMGHGVPAAAAMAQMRASVRTLLTVDPAPARVLEHLQTMFALLGADRLVTLVYGLFEPGAGRLTLVNAGHHAPLVIRPDGGTEWVTCRRRRLLGAEPDDCAPAEVRFGPGDTLLLFTDGLVERRDEVVDTGLDRLEKAAGRLAGGDLAPALAELVTLVRGPGADDDVTALAVRAEGR